MFSLWCFVCVLTLAAFINSVGNMHLLVVGLHVFMVWVRSVAGYLVFSVDCLFDLVELGLGDLIWLRCTVGLW